MLYDVDGTGMTSVYHTDKRAPRAQRGVAEPVGHEQIVANSSGREFLGTSRLLARTQRARRHRALAEARALANGRLWKGLR